MVAEVASRSPIRTMVKARQGCGHDVRNRRSDHGWSVCRPRRTDDQGEEQQLESAHFSATLSFLFLAELEWQSDSLMEVEIWTE